MSIDIYSRLGRYYDRIFAHIDHRRWASFIRRCWRRFHYAPRTVADVSCGTGDLSALLSRHGYKVTGIDLSPNMLAEARRKYGDLPIQWSQQDMCSLSLKQAPVDALVSAHTNLNYLLNVEQLRMTIERFWKNLRSGGICIFDVSSEANVYRFFDQQKFQYDFPEVSYTWTNRYDPQTRLFHAHFKIQPQKNGTPNGEPFEEYHPHYIFTVDEITSCIEPAHWDILGITRDFTFKRVNSHTNLIFFLLQKK